MEIISKSDAIVSVSETMVDQFKSEYKVQSHFIPLMGLNNQLEKTIEKKNRSSSILLHRISKSEFMAYHRKF